MIPPGRDSNHACHGSPMSGENVSLESSKQRGGRHTPPSQQRIKNDQQPYYQKPRFQSTTVPTPPPHHIPPEPRQHVTMQASQLSGRIGSREDMLRRQAEGPLRLSSKENPGTVSDGSSYFEN